MVELGAERADVVAITAAMMLPVGLKEFADALPRADLRRRHRRAARDDHGGRARVCRPPPGRRDLRDVPQPGLRPAPHGLRAAPGRRHLRPRPGRRHRPRRRLPQRHVGHDASPASCRAFISPPPGTASRSPSRCAEAVDIDDAPSVIRFPKGTIGEPIPAVRSAGGVDVLAEPDDGEVDVLLVGIGAMVATALTAAEKLAAEGIRVRVVDPVWALPVSGDLVELARAAGRVAVIEDNVVSGGSAPRSPGCSTRPGSSPGRHLRDAEGVPPARLPWPGPRPDRPHPRGRRRPLRDRLE